MTNELLAPLSDITNRGVATEAYQQALDSHRRIDFGMASPRKKKSMLFAVELKESASHQLWINTSPLSGDATFGGDIFYSDANGGRCACLASFAETTVTTDLNSTSDTYISSLELVSFQCEIDPVIEGLIQLALLALEIPEKLTSVFATYLAGVLHSHVIERYEFSPGNMVVPGGMARWQVRRATCEGTVECEPDGRGETGVGRRSMRHVRQQFFKSICCHCRYSSISLAYPKADLLLL